MPSRATAVGRWRQREQRALAALRFRLDEGVVVPRRLPRGAAVLGDLDDALERAAPVARVEDHVAVGELRQLRVASASLASPDGSWVALNDRGNEGDYGSFADPETNPKLWGFGEPNDYGDGEDCVFVDPRGTYNNLNDQAKQAVKDAAGSGVHITF